MKPRRAKCKTKSQRDFPSSASCCCLRALESTDKTLKQISTLQNQMHQTVAQWNLATQNYQKDCALMFFLQGKVHFGSIPIVNFVPSRVHDMVSRLSMIDLSFFFCHSQGSHLAKCSLKMRSHHPLFVDARRNGQQPAHQSSHCMASHVIQKVAK